MATAPRSIAFYGFGVICGMMLGGGMLSHAGPKHLIEAVDLQPAAAESEHLKLGKPERKEQLLTRGGFVALHDNQRKISLWAAYHLTADHLKHPGPRLPSSAFKPDPDLRDGERAELADYRRSGFDRGHLVPSGDMRRAKEIQAESFYLSNIVPQNGHLNQQPWRELEDQVREWVKESDEAYIYVGSIPGSGLRTIGRNRVIIPDCLFKIVACKREGKWHAIDFVADNERDAGNAEEWIVRIRDIELLSGFDFLSALPQKEQDELENRLPRHLADW